MITLPQQGTWLPADTQTPISLYLTLVRDKQGFLLESTEVDGRLGRYSLIGWDYRLILSCAGGKLDVYEGLSVNGKVGFTGDVIRNGLKYSYQTGLLMSVTNEVAQ